MAYFNLAKNKKQNKKQKTKTKKKTIGITHIIRIVKKIKLFSNDKKYILKKKTTSTKRFFPKKRTN